jgi:hypothetical protein
MAKAAGHLRALMFAIVRSAAFRKRVHVKFYDGTKFPIEELFHKLRPSAANPGQLIARSAM